MEICTDPTCMMLLCVQACHFVLAFILDQFLTRAITLLTWATATPMIEIFSLWEWQWVLLHITDFQVKMLLILQIPMEGQLDMVLLVVTQWFQNNSNLVIHKILVDHSKSF
jgi:hypothetical protein